jgi:hypothetical protein
MLGRLSIPRYSPEANASGSDNVLGADHQQETKAERLLDQ